MKFEKSWLVQTNCCEIANLPTPTLEIRRMLGAVITLVADSFTAFSLINLVMESLCIESSEISELDTQGMSPLQ